MTENNQTKAKTPYLYYSLIFIIVLILSGFFLIGIAIYLVYLIVDLLISTVSPYAYYKENIKYKKRVDLYHDSGNNHCP